MVSTLFRPVIFEKLFSHGRYHQNRDESTVVSLHCNIMPSDSKLEEFYEVCAPCHPALNRHQARMNVTVWKDVDLWRSWCPLSSPFFRLFTRTWSLYISASRRSPGYWHIGVFANHLEGLMNYGRVLWFRSFLSGEVLFEDHYLSRKVSVVDYRFSVMLKCASSFDFGAIQSKTKGGFFCSPALHCKKCFSYLDFLFCFQPKYLKILKSRRIF